MLPIILDNLPFCNGVSQFLCPTDQDWAAPGRRNGPQKKHQAPSCPTRSWGPTSDLAFPMDVSLFSWIYAGFAPDSVSRFLKPWGLPSSAHPAGQSQVQAPVAYTSRFGTNQIWFSAAAPAPKVGAGFLSYSQTVMFDCTWDSPFPFCLYYTISTLTCQPFFRYFL